MAWCERHVCGRSSVQEQRPTPVRLAAAAAVQAAARATLRSREEQVVTRRQTAATAGLTAQLRVCTALSQCGRHWVVHVYSPGTAQSCTCCRQQLSCCRPTTVTSQACMHLFRPPTHRQHRGQHRQVNRAFCPGGNSGSRTCTWGSAGGARQCEPWRAHALATCGAQGRQAGTRHTRHGSHPSAALTRPPRVLALGT
jgi:hypothetical protein